MYNVPEISPLVQVQNPHNIKYSGTVQGLKYIWRTEGFRGLFKGNGTNCARIVPNSAVKFFSYEQASKYVSNTDQSHSFFSVSFILLNCAFLPFSPVFFNHQFSTLKIIFYFWVLNASFCLVPLVYCSRPPLASCLMLLFLFLTGEYYGCIGRKLATVSLSLTVYILFPWGRIVSDRWHSFGDFTFL